MLSYNFLDAISGVIGLTSTAAVIVWLIASLQPRFKRVRDLCRACQPPDGRAQLLWTSFLVPIVWVAAAALYFRNLVTLWDIMGACLESQPVNRLVYALLHCYLYFLLLCGIYACTITIVEISRNRQVFGDLVMIARFKTSGYQVVEDTESQRGSSATGRTDLEMETASVGGDVRDTSSALHDEGLRSNAPEVNEDVAPSETRARESVPNGGPYSF